jgi:hypothetical protein
LPSPIINLNALGIGVTAYSGATGMLKTPEIIATAARLLAAEAEHVGSSRTQVARLKIPSSPVNGADFVLPPTGRSTQYLSINFKNGLPATRTAGQVLYLALGMKAGVKRGGFFPTGLAKLQQAPDLLPNQTLVRHKSAVG